MLATRSLGSLVFWGPPGTGKTTVARLLAQATDLHFEQISAIFTGVADLKKVFEEARRRREMGQGTLLFVDEIHRFNRAEQMEDRRLPLDAAARDALKRMADGDGRAALTLAEEVWRAARKDEVFDSAKLQDIVQRRAPIYDIG